MKKKTNSAGAVLTQVSELTEEQLHANRPFLKAVLEHLPEGVFIVSAKADEPVIQNRAAASFSAYLLGMADADGKATELYDCRGAKIPVNSLPVARALRGESLTQQEYLIFDAAGSERFLHINASPLKHQHGAVFAAVVTCADVTASRQAQQALQQRERRFRELFENASDIIYTHDLTGQITSFNQAATILLGYTESDMPLRISDIVSPADQKKAYAMMAKRLNGQETSSYELEVMAKTGETYILEVNPRLIVAAGKPVEIEGVARNITERKQKEAELKASEERFFTIFNSNPLPMSLHTIQEARYVDVNESWVKESGFRRDEVLGRTEEEVGSMKPEAYQQLRAQLRKTRSIQNLEVNLRHKSGEPRTGLFFTEPLEINREKCLLTTILDITERKKQEEQLLLSQREWRTTFDAIPDAIVLVDADDCIIRANKAFYEMNQLSEATAVGRTMKDLLHTNRDFLSADVCPLCQMRDERKSGTIELPPGIVTPYPLLASIIPIFAANGEYQATLQVVRDLSALYSAREEAAQERVSLNATIEQMAEGLMIFDEQGRVLRANSSAQAIFGYTLEAMRADPGGRLIDDRFADRKGKALAPTEHPIRQALREKQTVNSRIVWYTRPDAGRASLSISASPFFNENGRLTGAVAIVRDVTLQQMEQERLLQADKLRALGQLASGVAHNFNNVLAAILGYSQLGLKKTSEPELQNYLRIIEQASKDAARMVERIQNFSRTHSKKSKFTSVRIVDIVRDAIDITRPRWRNDAEALGIKYRVVFEGNVPEDLCVSGESSELREVFVNIILNSLDAMPQGGQVVISATASKDRLKIVTRDLGIGMTEEVKRRIFEPFFTTKGAAGQGLGLSESYRIVERHHGQLDVESEPMRGTIFTITLPLLVPRIVRAKRGKGDVALPKKRFLVIDDEEVVRYAFALVLEDLGHEVAQAANAQEALALQKTSRFDLVFTDLAMPDVDGIAVAKQIKAQQPNIKIVLMSGYDLDKIQERVKGSHSIDGTMSKPFQIPEIQKVIQRLLG